MRAGAEEITYFLTLAPFFLFGETIRISKDGDLKIFWDIFLCAYLRHYHFRSRRVVTGH